MPLKATSTISPPPQFDSHMNTESTTPPVVLVVDDEERNRELLQSFLEQDGYDVYVAESGAEALLLAKGVSPDLILLDVMMPGMDGFETCRRLREEAELKQVPVVMVTALDDRDSKLKGLEAGADEFLTKPIDVVELRIRARTVARLNRVRQLQTERSKFENIADESRDAYLIVTAVGIVTYANATARRLAAGLRPDGDFLDAIRESDWELEPADGWKSWAALWDAPAAVRYLLRPPGEGRSASWWQVELRDLDPPSPGERLCRITDVSSLLNQQRELWSFHSVLAHKFRTPLTGIIASIDLLEMDAAEGDAEILSGLKSAARRFHTQVQSVLRYVEAPRLIDGDPVTVSAVLDAAERLAADKDIVDVSCQAADAVQGLHLALSEQGVEAILVAILDNSRRYHPKEYPAIEIEVDRLAEGPVLLRITDNGTHIEPEKLHRVGQPYFQAEKYFTGEAPGMGIGLAMVGTILRERGGQCAVHNREDAPGVVVELTIPVVVPGSDEHQGTPPGQI